MVEELAHRFDRLPGFPPQFGGCMAEDVDARRWQSSRGQVLAESTIEGGACHAVRRRAGQPERLLRSHGRQRLPDVLKGAHDRLSVACAWERCANQMIEISLAVW